MDSYDYYLLYHQNKKQFMSMFCDNDEEILVALSKLCKNKKLNGDCELFFEKILTFIENDTRSNFNLDEILQQLITHKSYQLTKKNLLESNLNVPKMRVAKVLVDFALLNSYVDDDIQQICEFLIECVFKESNVRPYAIGLLYTILKESQQLKAFILNKIFENSVKRSDLLGMQNLCYFFRQLCENGFKLEQLDFLENYFKNDSISVRKQGLYLLKCLLDYKLLNEENLENWTMFISILETLEENQSHLILPSLELLYKMKVHESFEKCWFILCSLIIQHENNMVRSYGLNYLFEIKENAFQRHQVLIILEALNVNYLYDPNEKYFLENVQKFIQTNSVHVFELLIDINWFSVPFYHILNCLRATKIFKNPSKKFLINFENQTKIIPKRIRNVKIRAIVKNIYAELLDEVMEHFDIEHVLPIFNNIFNINSNQDCLHKCISRLTREDYEHIFCDKYDYKFVKFILFKTHLGREIDEIRSSAKHITNNQKLIMEVMCDLNEIMDGYEDMPNVLVYESIESIWTFVTEHQFQKLCDSIELLEIGLNASKTQIENETFDHLKEIWMKLSSMINNDPQFDYAYLKLSSILLKHDPQFDSKLMEKNCFSQKEHSPNNLLVLTCCQTFIMGSNIRSGLTNNCSYIDIILENIETLLDRSSVNTDIFDIYDVLKNLTANLSPEVLQCEELFDKIKKIIRNFLITASNIIDLTLTFWKSFLDYAWQLIDNEKYSTQWTRSFEFIYSDIIENLNENDKFSLLLSILDFMNRFPPINNNLIKFYKSSLIEAMFDVNIMSRDEQLEYSLTCRNDDETIKKLSFRLSLAQLFNSLYGNEFSDIVGKKILELAEISKKKPRYYPNSKIHRLKLHYFQPLVFCETIEKNVMDVLINELLWVNNQLNVIYMLEIILASHHPNIIRLLNDNTKELKAQALKSIFSIAIMQIRIEKDFKKAEQMIDDIFKYIFPYSMGQNFGVRIYSLLTVVLSFEHIQSLPDFVITSTISKISDICKIIYKSVDQKNCLKYFNALQNDFRFTKDYKELKTYQIFYCDIPNATKMTFEEIIPVKDRQNESIVAADMVKETDCIVMNDEIELRKIESSSTAVINLQQKYLPLKNQIPSENLLRTLPERFKVYDNREEGHLNSRSELIVVASLIDNDTNLGGLARTCEIFGISKYVIHSLKSQENLEFKTLSRTSEKWIHISEIKNWQLFDYLLKMKTLGYAIVGAEQSGSSISLLEVNIPKKCVLLLGNERKGIPADLLALVDIIIEIPQTGVVRSLNVHVAGAILIWEYAKQHTFK